MMCYPSILCVESAVRKALGGKSELKSNMRGDVLSLVLCIYVFNKTSACECVFSPESSSSKHKLFSVSWKNMLGCFEQLLLVLVLVCLF